MRAIPKPVCSTVRSSHSVTRAAPIYPNRSRAHAVLHLRHKVVHSGRLSCSCIGSCICAGRPAGEQSHPQHARPECTGAFTGSVQVLLVLVHAHVCLSLSIGSRLSVCANLIRAACPAVWQFCNQLHKTVLSLCEPVYALSIRDPLHNVSTCASILVMYILCFCHTT